MSYAARYTQSSEGKAFLTSVVASCVLPLVMLPLACHGAKCVRGAIGRNVFCIVLHAARYYIHDLCGGAWHGSLDYGSACVAFRYVECAWHAPRILVAVALLSDESGPVTMTPLTLNDGRISSRFHGAAHGTREIPRNGVRLAGGLPGNVEVEARQLLTEGRERPVIGRHGPRRAPTGTADHDERADHDAEADQERSHRDELDERRARAPRPPVLARDEHDDVRARDEHDDGRRRCGF